jgi:hypothetical protein
MSTIKWIKQSIVSINNHTLFIFHSPTTFKGSLAQLEKISRWRKLRCLETMTDPKLYLNTLKTYFSDHLPCFWFQHRQGRPRGRASCATAQGLHILGVSKKIFGPNMIKMVKYMFWVFYFIIWYFALVVYELMLKLLMQRGAAFESHVWHFLVYYI